MPYRPVFLVGPQRSNLKRSLPFTVRVDLDRFLRPLLECAQSGFVPETASTFSDEMFSGHMPQGDPYRFSKRLMTPENSRYLRAD
jgi:hypothetical protein